MPLSWGRFNGAAEDTGASLNEIGDDYLAQSKSVAFLGDVIRL